MPRPTLTLKNPPVYIGPLAEVNDPEPSPDLKIAIVGSGASSLGAPFKDDSWTIWAFSRKQFRSLPRFDKWFELHDERNFQAYETRDHLKGYIEFLKGENVVLQEHFPKDNVLDKFGTWFLTTGQAPWLMAYALLLKPQVIGLWGIDAIGPHKPQRKELQHFCWIAQQDGVEIVVPEDCTLLEPEELYAFRTPKR